jgi:hypothetical protein
VHDRRGQLPQYAPHPQIGSRILARPLIQRHHFDVVSLDSPSELGIETRQANDRVSVSLGRQAIDEIDEPILESAIVEAMDDVHDQWQAARH